MGLSLIISLLLLLLLLVLLLLLLLVLLLVLVLVLLLLSLLLWDCFLMVYNKTSKSPMEYSPHIRNPSLRILSRSLSVSSLLLLVGEKIEGNCLQYAHSMRAEKRVYGSRYLGVLLGVVLNDIITSF